MDQSKRSVIGIVFSENRDQILLIKRRDVPVWALPGGGIDPLETPEEAVIREIQEETGIVARIVRHAALYTPINALAYPTFVFECAPVSGVLSKSDETQGVAYFFLDKLPQTFFFIHREWVEEALKETSGTIHKPLSQITYWNLLKYFVRHPVQTFRLALARCGIPYNDR
ncbi:MAG: NUDIX domain-containing protein [Parachlamydiaceae bacterium]